MRPLVNLTFLGTNESSDLPNDSFTLVDNSFTGKRCIRIRKHGLALRLSFRNSGDVCILTELEFEVLDFPVVRFCRFANICRYASFSFLSINETLYPRPVIEQLIICLVIFSTMLMLASSQDVVEFQ